MGKIRVQDLARSMGLDKQDLVFKLKSIGVRVEGDEALIDTEIIQAILQGRKLPQPREVILRDDDAPPPVDLQQHPQARRPAPGKPRRSMIQRVERPIREIEVRQMDSEDRPDTGLPVEETTVPVETPTTPAPVPVATTPAPAEAVPEASAAKDEAAKTGPETQATAAPAAPATPAAAPAAPADPVATPAAPQQAKKPSPGQQPADKSPRAKDAKSEARKPASPPVKQTPRSPQGPAKGAAGSRPGPARPGARPGTAPARPGGPSRPTRPSGPSSRPASQRGRRGGQDSRGRRPPHRQDDRRPARIIVPVEQPRREPVSARGHRRVEKRKDKPMRSTSGLKFKESKPTGPITISEGMTVREFAEKIDVKAKDLIRVLVMRGVMANINHVLDNETARALAEEMGIEVMEVTFEEEVQLRHELNLEGTDAPKSPRAPVVTVMGHVDHGKTTLLDRIRSANVAEGEAGGITQHIGAYHVDVGSNQIVFLDTPGHEAFTLMRARGASVTDIVILVVAADDSVMPQTIEAINHAKAAKVPIVVAINKIDKANANLDRVRKELADHGLMVEDWGGDVVSSPISALNDTGITELLELVTLTSDMLELKASPGLPAHGAVLEARKEVGRGIIATVLVQNGTLRVGDTFVAGSAWGKVRIMTNDRGQRIQEAGPSTPVEVTGFTDVPAAGDLIQIMEDESKARNIAELRKHEQRQRGLRPMAGRMTLEQLFSQNKDEVKELGIIVKADVDGSVEVLRETLRKLSTEKVKVKVLHAAVGAITNNDVIFASASNAIIVGFNVRPEKSAVSLAEKEEVDILLHTVIYELSDELKRAMTGLLEPTFREVHTGTAEVRNTFKIPKIGVIAGSHIVEGSIPRNAQLRLLRDSRVIWEGRISSLRRFKEDVSEVRSGFDCGIGLERFQDIKPGDSLEAFTREEVAPVL